MEVIKNDNESNKKRIIIVDSSNLSRIEEDLPQKLKYSKFFKFLAKNKKTEIFFYLETKKEKENKGEENQYPLYRFLAFILNRLGPELENDGISFRTFFANKRNADSMIISDIAEILIRKENEFEEIILISGDGDFSKILELAKTEGIDVTVVAGKQSCSHLLKDVANKIYYIQDIVESNIELLLNH